MEIQLSAKELEENGSSQTIRERSGLKKVEMMKENH
jgi:hypothetical protein